MQTTELMASDFSFERNFESESTRTWMQKYWSVSIVASFVYMAFLFLCQKAMHHRPAFKLQKPLILWNAFLAIFSIMGTIRLFPEFVHTLKNYGFHDSYCRAGDFYKGASGLWMWLFTLSKMAEFGDSIFIVLRKKPLIFLHWYHHAATCIYLWYQYQWEIGSARWGTMMNFFVHSIMYSYYALRAANFRIPTKISMCITGLQLVQMAVGSYICWKVFSIVFLRFDSPASCPHPKAATIWQFVMYATYLFLFAQFFYRSYIAKRPKQA